MVREKLGLEFISDSLQSLGSSFLSNLPPSQGQVSGSSVILLFPTCLFTQHILWACLLCVRGPCLALSCVWFNHPRNLRRYMWWAQLYRWRNCGSESLIGLPKVAQLLGRAGLGWQLALPTLYFPSLPYGSLLFAVTLLNILFLFVLYGI